MAALLLWVAVKGRRHRQLRPCTAGEAWRVLPHVHAACTHSSTESLPLPPPFAVHSQVFSKYKSSVTGIVSSSATLASSAVRSLGSPHQLLSAHLHARYDMLVWQTLVNYVLLGVSHLPSSSAQNVGQCCASSC